ncbi:hypothetical protein HA402_015872 [Bradysia odoriphaga]|nr:hypothetical protein HA402_015872 [Bradysia odoriphaga]
MCDIESVNKIAKYLKVNAGKISYNSDKVITRSTKTENLSGFTSILNAIARESNVDCCKSISTDDKLQCLVYQWIEYAFLFVAPAAKNKHVAATMLKELNGHLSTRSYVAGSTQLTVADLAIFFAIQPVMATLSPSEKENYINISRWYNHLQLQNLIRQGSPLINFSTLHLHGATGGHA